ncbi:MAG TPA: hypothetical protein VJU80_08980 [Solirubrobacteraceae bacterium]|nr:hypothetical protein [Solirubrobacteraceae bacterium]
MSAEWTGCAHCGQTLPHEGTGWREASRCRLFQRIAERAWDEGYDRRGDAMRSFGKEAPFHLTPPNPYRLTEPTP